MKMNTGEKITLTITLHEYDAKVLDKALQTVYGLTGFGRQDVTWRERNFVLGWAIRSVCAAIIRAGEMSVPFAVELRPQTEDEDRARTAGELPGQPTDGDDFGFQNSRWN